MRIVFIGCKNIGFECLRELLDSRPGEIVSVYTLDESQAQETSGFRSFDALMKDSAVPFHKVKDINAPLIVDRIKKDRPDLIIQVGWSQIMKDEVLGVPPLGCVGFHSSLLPKYRGGAPVNWGIINGETEWGITFFYMEPGLDSGDIIAQRKFEISLEDTCKTVYDKATQYAIEILREYVDQIKEGRAPKIKQDESKVTRVKRRKPEDGLIDWNNTAMKLYNWVRALTHPYPGAFTFCEGKKMLIWEAKLTDADSSSYSPGEVIRVSDYGFVVATKTQGILVTSVQMEGEEELPIKEAIRRYNIKAGVRLSEHG